MTLISNEQNHAAWPRVVSHDLQRHVQQLKRHMYVVTGELQGKTLLPLPLSEELITSAVDRINE